MEPEDLADDPNQIKAEFLRKVAVVLLKMFPCSYMKDLWKQQNTVRPLS